MADIYDYIRVLLLQGDKYPDIFGGYGRKDELLTTLTKRVEEVLADYDVSELIDSREIASRLFGELLSAGVIVTLEEEFAGTYHVGAHQKYIKFRDSDLASNTIFARQKAIGSRYYNDVFSGFKGRYVSGELGMPSLGLAPASNRIVTFSDNEVLQLYKQSSELIEELSNQNQVDNNPGLRELVLGQLRAGRELIRAGSARVYLIQLTLIETLRFLARRYDGELIGGLAGALITALIKQLGIDA